MNFLFGQWKDGFIPVLRADQKSNTIKLGVEGALHKGERSRFLLSYDGRKFRLYQDGIVRNSREMGPLTFSNWDKTYPLVVGMDATGHSQWKGTIYEIAVFDRALTSGEVKRLSGPSGLSSLSGREEKKADSRQQQTTRQENPPVSPFFKGGKSNERPLIHYVFRQENTYETEFRGKRALGVRDLGKGAAADLVIPEQFMPYQRVYLGWNPDWTRNRSDWEDVVINIAGFVPFGFLLFVSFAKSRKGIRLQASGISLKTRKEGFGKKEEENPPQSPFFKEGKEAIRRDAALAVVLAVAVGFGVSFAIEYLQAYLPSRDSSLRDLITNVLGTFIGALASAWMMSRRNALVTGDQ
jgi:hypothetical protein